MSDRTLAGRRVAILATDGFEQSELVEPMRRLLEAGATVTLLSNHEGDVQGMLGLDRLDRFPVDARVTPEMADGFAGLVVPGGVKSPDKLRTDPASVEFVRRFIDAGRPVAAVCHGPALLIETGRLGGRTVTSYPSLRTDVLNAGGEWVDAEVIDDDGLITSRRPEDLPAFCDAFEAALVGSTAVAGRR
jgi:protease I